MTALVEGFAPDAVAVAGLLAREGRTVRLAGAGPAPPAARALEAEGVEVVEHADLDRASFAAEVAFLDVWTPEVAPRVARLRASGTRISSIGDLVLERASAPVVGVTGTAGKTTTAGLVTHLLEASGLVVLASAASRSGNRWPDATLLEGAAGLPADAILVVELTSSHLAFMSSSPKVAVVTSFWPDHLELHGSLEAYRRAKETIVRHQRAGDRVVVDLAKEEVEAFARSTPAARVGFGSWKVPGAAAWVEGASVVIDDGGRRHAVPLPEQPVYRDARAGNVAAACAAALSVGVPAEVIGEALATAPAPPHRLRDAGMVDGVRVVDDGMAATPAKAQATLAGFPDRSIILLCGGDDAPASGAVHASAPERQALEAACSEIARVAVAVVAFGPAGERLRDLLDRRGVPVSLVDGLDAAVPAAMERRAGAKALVFAPMFPVAAADRARFASLVCAAGSSPFGGQRPSRNHRR